MADKSNARDILDWVIHIVIAVVVGFLIVTFVAQRTVVYNYSMQPTLYEGDNLLVEKISPRIGNINPGDIVTIVDASKSLEKQNKTIIKRIIAVENDVIEIKDGKIYINGEVKEENYIKGDFTRPVNPEHSKLTVPKGHVYVLGDNRSANIVDSRSLGPIDIKKIEGKAIFRVFPFKKMGVLPR